MTDTAEGKGENDIKFRIRDCIEKAKFAGSFMHGRGDIVDVKSRGKFTYRYEVVREDATRTR